MKVAVLFVFAVAVAVASDVLVLTEANFDETVDKHSPILVEFYAPWCGHCQALEPEYEKAASALKSKGLSIAKVDATAETSLAGLFQVRGYPTLKLFKNGKFVQDYQGPRTADAIVSFIEKKSGKPYTVVSSSQEVDQILATEKSGVVVGYFESFDSENFAEFEDVAELEINTRFLVLTDPASASGCLLPEVVLGQDIALPVGSIAVLGKDGSKNLFNGDILTELSSFYYSHAFPQSFDLDPEIFSKFLATHTIIITAFDFAESNAESIRQLATVAASTQPSLKQMFADSKIWSQALVRMGVISGNVFPTAVAFLKGASQSTPPVSWDEDVELNAASFSVWLQDIVSGSAKTWKKSESVPTSNDGPVTVVVGKTFDQVVLDKSKDVLVEFYAPWCGHCKNLEPTYTALGEHFANDNNVIIAKIDATANYVDPSFGVQGFPTIKFFPAGEHSDVLDYEGTRTLDDLIEFINSNRNSK